MTRALLFCLGIASLLASACGAEITDGAQRAGQRCWAQADCAAGLVCTIERVCAPAALGLRDPQDAGVQPDADLPPDAGRDAEPGDAQDVCIGLPACAGPETVVVCEAGAPIERACPSETRCAQGACVPIGECVDEDQDQFSGNCEPLDCADDDPLTFPGAYEQCDEIDNDCDGTIDEECGGECCPDDCVSGALRFCSACTCVPYEPLVCTRAYQPCDSENTPDGRFACVEGVDPSGGPLCLGICNPRAPDPSATCPAPNQECIDVGDGETGLCLDRCNAGDSCGSNRLACVEGVVPSGVGVCLPTDPSAPGVGESCDPDDGPIACSEGALCLPFGLEGSICRPSCRPFTSGSGCGSGRSCLAISEGLGACVDDTTPQGNRCAEPFAACAEDELICVPLGPGGGTCTRQCRIDREGDCPGRRRCRNFGGLLSDEIGICTRF